MGITDLRVHRRYVPAVPDGGQSWRGCIVAVLALLLITLWSYGPLLRGLVRGWSTDEDYSAGQLVPLVTMFLVWRDRKTLRQIPLSPCWWGLVLVLLSQAARIFGLVFMFDSVERYSFFLAIVGLVLFVAGRQIFRRVVWILLFLFLMFPLPGRVHNMIGSPLQRLATTGSVFLMESLGIRVTQQGNIVMLGDNTPMAVAEACSGLRMLTAFVIVTAFIAYMVKRPRWQKGVLLVSSIPVAVICNIIRIFLTGMIILYVSVELGEKFFHDFAGLVMMPTAVSLIFAEIWLMDRLVVPDSDRAAGHGSESAKAGKGHGGMVVRKRTKT